MDLGAANRKQPGWPASRLCRQGSVIKSQGIEKNIAGSLYLIEMTGPDISSRSRRVVPRKQTSRPFKGGGFFIRC
jgi:hypothetical protein